MRVKIYQMDMDKYGTKFMDFDYTREKAGHIHPELYEEVFNADIDISKELCVAGQSVFKRKLCFYTFFKQRF